jgi:hypothetical protein
LRLQKHRCREEGWLERGEAGKIKSIGKLRSMVREFLREELEEIDGLAMNLIGSGLVKEI